MELTETKRKLFIFTLLAGTFTMSISQSALSTAYPALMHFFTVDAATIQWLTTGFMLMMCVMMPVSPWFLNNISFKHLYLSVLALFGIGTLMIIFAPTFWFALLGRLLEATAVGILFPSFQTVLMTITPKDKRGQTMGAAGLVMGSALAVGPIISGIVLNFLRWQALFWLFCFLMLVIFLAACVTISDVMEQKPSQLDVFSLFYEGAGLGMVLYALTAFKDPAHLLSSVLLLLLGLGLLIAFCQRQLKLAEPLLELQIVKYLDFDIGLLLTGLSYVSLIVVTIVFPLYYQKILGLSPLASGLSLVLPAVLLSVLNPITGKLADKWGFKPVLLVGVSMLLSGWAGLLLWQDHLVLPLLIAFSMVIEGGNAFVMMPATTLGANSVPKNLIAHATALTTTIRQLLGSLGVMGATLLLSNAGQSITQKSSYSRVFICFLLIEAIALVLALRLKEVKK